MAKTQAEADFFNNAEKAGEFLKSRGGRVAWMADIFVDTDHMGDMLEVAKHFSIRKFTYLRKFDPVGFCGEIGADADGSSCR